MTSLENKASYRTALTWLLTTLVTQDLIRKYMKKG
jgi:hypothetical protein